MIDSLMFSIIIPTFNSGKTLSTCLNSLSQQSFKNFEVVIIDNRSTDETLSIANDYLTDLNLKIYSEQDHGIYDAMNKGIDLSTGEYLYFLGSDDSLYDQYVLEKVATEAVKRNAEMIYGNAIISDGRTSYFHGGKFDLRRLMNDNISHQAIFYRKNIFGTLGSYNVKYELFADYDFNMRCFAKFSPHYLDLTVANFSKGGATSVQKDEAFECDKITNFINYNLKRLHTSAYMEVRLFIQKAALSNSLRLDISTRLYCLIAYTKLKVQSLLT